MSTEVEQRSEQVPAAAAPPPTGRHEVRDRLVLPLLLPVVACVVVVVFALNISRIFIAGKGTPAVVVASVAIAVILLGAALMSALKGLKPSQQLLGLSAAFLVVMLFGSMLIGAAEEHGEDEGGYVEPEGEPVASLEVHALQTLKFQADEFTVAGGIVDIQYLNIGNGAHTLAFDEPEFAGFLLRVQNDGDLDRGKVELAEGEYTIYCTIPGHRAAGMEAALVVTAPAAGGGGTPPPAGASGGTGTSGSGSSGSGTGSSG